jgi:hypothetical protein
MIDSCALVLGKRVKITTASHQLIGGSEEVKGNKLSINRIFFELLKCW